MNACFLQWSVTFSTILPRQFNLTLLGSIPSSAHHFVNPLGSSASIVCLENLLFHCVFSRSWLEYLSLMSLRLHIGRLDGTAGVYFLASSAESTDLSSLVFLQLDSMSGGMSLLSWSKKSATMMYPCLYSRDLYHGFFEIFEFPHTISSAC